MSRILALDTSTEACSCALWLDGEIVSHFELAPRKHTKIILPLIDQLLADAGVEKRSLDAVAFGRGPGSFTGVRIAASIAQGIAFSLDTPILPISTLAALAQQGVEEYQAEKVISLMDARMGEVYHAQYVSGDDGIVALDGTEQVIKPDLLTAPEDSGWLSLGSGWTTYGELLTNVMGEKVAEVHAEHWPDSKYIVQLAAHAYAKGEAVAPELGLPVYLRDKVADTIEERMKKREAASSA